MTKTSKLLVLMALALALITTPIVVAQGAGSMFKFGTDAKSLAMGGAFVAVADNYSATYWNPAGLGQVKGFNLGGMSLTPRNINGLNLMYGGVAYSFEQLALGGSYGQFSADFSSQNSYNHEGTYSEGMGIASVAMSVRSVNVGANLKYYTMEGNTGLGFDGGLLMKFDGVSVGLSASDVGGTSIAGLGTVSQAYRVGVAARLMDTVLLSGQFDLAGTERKFRAGVELTPMEMLAIRGGVIMPMGGGSASITAGAGLNLAGLSVDIAWLQNSSEFAGWEEGGSGDTLVLSAGFSFGGEESE